MIKKIVFILFLIYSLTIYCDIPYIDINGTAEFTSIQEAINASLDGDSLIVYPGIYYENLDFQSKSLVLASTYIFTEIDSIINSTIIDGNQTERCILIEYCDDAAVIGFTIQNGDAGYNSRGGGIYNDNSSTSIENCKIIDNHSTFGGGGIYNYSSNINLKGNTIAYNYANYKGGGFHSSSSQEYEIIFDQEELNNVYLNYAADAADISFSHNHDTFSVYIDTFTVQEPSCFFAAIPPNIELVTLNSKIEEIENDLYVSPDGSDDNNGLTPENPLQTIAWAQTLIKSDSLNNYKIHLENGIYSPSLNNQKFPLNTKNYTKIEGESRENTILDAENQTNIIHSSSRFNLKFFSYKNVTLTNGYSPYIYSSCIFLKGT
ncbi:MAG: hypothetical protein KAT74_07905, partial [Candidatus Cloacimonetes bacterium]|nr:hypothetical protein [Candidatus Cloacimonadota bacterium]